ncbi:hypothetical protein HYH03_006806 [Edaphochlamys debaryana]|uniref:Uncharacterized protein n=1 Tax=Edaphochlamys debaryana TaxID=47281 RepID=A0A835YA83_9CHLO|nr:hypothetical protein HYH03_006806 [Edaphochlamys debaryana]|eukprot:KAG2495200.1 hypothetical protein HYH03_006806 [Edaphochlamys debaryana]
MDVRSNVSYAASTDTVDAVSSIAGSCKSVTASSGPGVSASLPAVDTPVPFVEGFSGQLKPEHWDSRITTYDRLSYQPRGDSSTPGDQEAVVGPLATHAYLQTPPMIVSAAAAGGTVEVRLDKLQMPVQAAGGRGIFLTPIFNILFSVDNGRNWTSLFEFSFDAWTGSPRESYIFPHNVSVNIASTIDLLQGGIDIMVLRIEILCEAGLHNQTLNPFLLDGLSLSGVTYIGTNDDEPSDSEPLVSYTPYQISGTNVLVPLGTTGFEDGFNPLVWFPSDTWSTIGMKQGGNVAPLSGSKMAISGDGSVPSTSAELYSRALLAGPGSSMSFYMSLAGGKDCWPLDAYDGRDPWRLVWRSLMTGASPDWADLNITGRDPYFNRQGWVKVWADFPFDDWTYFQIAFTHTYDTRQSPTGSLPSTRRQPPSHRRQPPTRQFPPIRQQQPGSQPPMGRQPPNGGHHPPPRRQPPRRHSRQLQV